MRRLILSTTLLAAVILGMASPVWVQASVPNLINFQGKLTDNAGNPVSDGVHNFTFRIYAAAVAGTLCWSEGPVALTTSNGFFNHSLGSVTPFSQTLFQDYDELFLEIEADGEIQSPRVPLISTPYTRVADGLEVRSALVPDTVAIRTVPFNHQLSTYGTDGKEQIRLWGGGWGELWLHDQDATNDLTVYLTANSSEGGELQLRNDNSLTTIDLHGGLSGDASVAVPNNAINALEIKDEPGVASNTESFSTLLISDTTQTIISRTITVPTSGYILVIGTAQVIFAHGNGTPTFGYFGVSNTAGSFPDNQAVRVQIPSTAPTGTYDQAVTVHGLFSVSAGTSTFYLLGRETSGDLLLLAKQLSLIYLPTAYGTVSPTKPVIGGPEIPDKSSVQGSALTAADIATERAEAEKFNAERIERELAQVKAEMEALKREVRDWRGQEQRIED